MCWGLLHVACNKQICDIWSDAQLSVWCFCQLEEVRGVPASSEKAITDAAARKEEMEKQKVKEEEKLKDVMESLKEETSGLQQDKEVCLIVLPCFVCL